MFKSFAIIWGIVFCFKLWGATELIPYTVYLKKGSMIKSLKDKKTYSLSEGKYVLVKELNPKRRDLFYIYDNDGNAVYETDAEGIVEIAPDIQLLPGINAEKIYPPKSAFKAADRMALFESQLSLNVETMDLKAFNDIYSDNITYVIANRFEARTLYISELPFQFGFNLNYQTAYWKNDYEEIKLSILSLGPQIKYKFFERDKFNAHALISVELAPFYQGNTDRFTDKYNAQLYDLGVESQWQTVLGKIALGGHFRHHQVALSQSDRLNIEEAPEEFAVNSIGFNIGYKLEWEL